nr:MAG TPA: hypothetical protein [Caudoviricetes sp.]
MARIWKRPPLGSLKYDKTPSWRGFRLVLSLWRRNHS